MAGFEPADNFERKLILGVLQKFDENELEKRNEQTNILGANQNQIDLSSVSQVVSDASFVAPPVPEFKRKMRKGSATDSPRKFTDEEIMARRKPNEIVPQL